MPITHKYIIHKLSAALWPDHKPLAEVIELRDTTPPMVWSSTYQGEPTPEGGLVFLAEWWADPSRRYRLSDDATVVGRWISCDTALKDKDESDYTALLVVELLADYRLRIRDLDRNKYTFPNLPDAILRLAKQYNADGLLRGVVVEDRGSGTSAIQTLQQSTDQWLRQLLVPFMPSTSKQMRAEQAGVWSKLGCVLLPVPSSDSPWLLTFTEELLQFPSADHDDCVDAYSQILIYLEHLISVGWQLRNSGRQQE